MYYFKDGQVKTLEGRPEDNFTKSKLKKKKKSKLQENLRWEWNDKEEVGDGKIQSSM